ncbi:NAD-dependent epimerase/dehydratase family protein [SAR86 cluster bacterium]|nr:NAD-dependent epimerase/dehydratase family protein [SAR86 cluster bacterium]
MRQILIIGGQGFIGKHLANFYMAEDYKVVTTTRFHQIVDNNCLQLDYSKESFQKLFKEQVFEKIFFLTGNPYPGLSIDDCNIDIEQTFVPLVNAVETLKELSYEGDFWFASSVAVYGSTELDIQSEDDICKPLSNYAVIKLAGENYLSMMSLTSELYLGSLRIFSTFGENLKRQLIYDIYQKIKDDPQNIYLFGSGEEVRDLSYVGDQVQRIKIVADSIRPKGDVYNIGSGEATSINSIAEEVVKIMGHGTKINYTSESRIFDGSSWVANMNKMQKLAPNPKSPLLISLERTINSLED